jgi:hypothetical protein
VSQEITVGTKTVPVVSASQGTVCANTSVVLTATNCSNGLVWNTGATTGSITVTPQQSQQFIQLLVELVLVLPLIALLLRFRELP